MMGGVNELSLAVEQQLDVLFERVARLVGNASFADRLADFLALFHFAPVEVQTHRPNQRVIACEIRSFAGKWIQTAPTYCTVYGIAEVSIFSIVSACL